LHGDGGEENGGNIVLVGGFVESVDVGTAGTVGAAGPGEDGGEVLGDHLVDGEVGWAPATVLDATVEPIDGSIGTARGSRVGCGTNISTSTRNVNGARLVLSWRVVRRRRRGGRRSAARRRRGRVGDLWGGG